MEFMSNPICKQCGYSHPPVADGSCPLKPSKDPEGNEIKWQLLFDPLKTVLESKIKMLNLKKDQVETLLKKLIVNSIQFIEKEGYK